MDKKQSDLDDTERFETVVTEHGTAYRPKNYPGPITIDAKIDYSYKTALGRHDFPTSMKSTEFPNG